MTYFKSPFAKGPWGITGQNKCFVSSQDEHDPRSISFTVEMDERDKAENGNDAAEASAFLASKAPELLDMVAFLMETIKFQRKVSHPMPNSAEAQATKLLNQFGYDPEANKENADAICEETEKSNHDGEKKVIKLPRALQLTPEQIECCFYKQIPVMLTNHSGNIVMCGLLYDNGIDGHYALREHNQEKIYYLINIRKPSNMHLYTTSSIFTV